MRSMDNYKKYELFKLRKKKRKRKEKNKRQRS